MTATGSVRGRHILIAEDNEINMEILADHLTEQGAIVDRAWNGTELLEKFTGRSRSYYDLILTDNTMPGKNGTEAVRELRRISNGRGKRVPVIMLSSDDRAELSGKAAAAGVDALLGKPYRFSELKEQIERLLPAREERSYDHMTRRNVFVSSCAH